MKFEEVYINYHRLLRHYQFNLKKYDKIALLDLSHSLRMWVDMKVLVDDYIEQNPLEKKFKSNTVSKSLNRLINKYEYFCVRSSRRCS